MGFVLIDGRYEYRPDSEQTDNTTIVRPSPEIIKKAIEATKIGEGKDLVSVEAQLNRKAKSTPQLSQDNRIEAQRNKDKKATKEQ